MSLLSHFLYAGWWVEPATDDNLTSSDRGAESRPDADPLRKLFHIYFIFQTTSLHAISQISCLTELNSTKQHSSSYCPLPRVLHGSQTPWLVAQLSLWGVSPPMGARAHQANRVTSELLTSAAVWCCTPLLQTQRLWGLQSHTDSSYTVSLKGTVPNS